MARTGPSLPMAQIEVNASESAGPLELWRHTLSLGGVNSLPLPPRMVARVRALRPRLIRIFIQEFFRIYRGNGQFDWGRLDPYMASLAATGAKIVAAITIKPAALYPDVDQAHWRPRDVGEWQHVIGQLVRRYSVERPIVTHWEVGNETNFGEKGGCPYLITEPEEYGEYYSMTIRPILEAYPQAQVGGPAISTIYNKLMAGFVDYCRRTGAQLDFISWHIYNSNPAAHAECVRIGRSLVEGYPGRRPETMVTEWNRGLAEPMSVETEAFEQRWSAFTAAAVVDMIEAGLDWSFYYHVWDQTFFHDEFAPFFSPEGVADMARGWNELPRRLGLFGVAGEVRAQYFVYAMLSRLGEERLTVECPAELRMLAGRSRGRVSVMAANYNAEESADHVAALHFRGVRPGVKRLTVRRIDDDRRWRPETLELLPLERRDVSTTTDFECQVLLPADTVAEVCLEDLTQ